MKKNSIILMGLAVVFVLAWVVYSAIVKNNDESLALNNNVATPTPTLSQALRGFDTQPTISPVQKSPENTGGTGETTKGGMPINPSPIITEKPVNSTSQATGSLIRLTDSGFVPSNLVVKLGSIITFVNETNQPLQMVEDTSGSRLLVGFNMSESIGKLGVYEYKVSSLGKTGFKNSKNSSQKGTLEIIN